jgi:hypothetical protein
MGAYIRAHVQRLRGADFEIHYDMLGNVAVGLGLSSDSLAGGSVRDPITAKL